MVFKQKTHLCHWDFPKCWRSLGRGICLSLVTNSPSVAVADFEEDEVVFSVPRSAVLNIKTALGTSTASSSQQNMLDMPSWLVR